MTRQTRLSSNSLTFLQARGGDGFGGERGDGSANANRSEKHSKKKSSKNKQNVVGNGNEEESQDDKQVRQNAQYIKGLMDNLEELLDKWIKTGTMATRRRAYNIHQQISRLSMDEELVNQATRLIKRAGMPLDPPPPVPPTKHIPADQQQQPQQQQEQSQSAASSCGGGVSLKTGNSPSSTIATSYAVDSDGSSRRDTADERIQWEQQHFNKNAFLSRMNQNESVPSSTDPFAAKQPGNAPRSALSARLASKEDPFLSSVVDGGSESNNKNNDNSGLDPFAFAQDKQSLQDSMKSSLSKDQPQKSRFNANVPTPDYATTKASELIARAGSGHAFEGDALGIGGLDDVLSQIQRRVWIPLAAPPSLLSELGIQPVRGLLLYGSPGCGKTLLARKLGQILSPARPITVVSGPEILDKFVGSSEKNLREVFDNPPELYFEFKKNYGEALDKTALHVIVLDEFDAIARARGGSGGKGDQGDAGVARDSVVNQLLAKMDGMDGLGVPTLLIGLTNQPWLIDPALMRPGRFEVQIEVPKPKTVAQRVAILKVHTESMMKSGRVLAKDASEGSAAWRRVQVLEAMGEDDIPTYAELLDLIAVECDGMSGASLAGVARAAASRALERAVTDFAGHAKESGSNEDDGNSIADCLVTKEDFEKAIEDVFESARGGEYNDKESSRSEDSNGSGEQMSNGADDSISNDDTTVSDYDAIELEDEPSDTSAKVAREKPTNKSTDKPTDNTQSMRSVNLKSLLPERKVTWRTLDKQGRKIEMDSEEMKYRDLEKTTRFPNLADGIVNPNEKFSDAESSSTKMKVAVANSHSRDNSVVTKSDVTSHLSSTNSGDGGGEADDANSAKNTQKMKSVNLTNLLPERKVTWMKLDRKGRRIEVHPYSEKSGMKDITNERTVSDPGLDRGPGDSVEDRIELNAENGTEEDVSEEGKSDTIPTENIQPIKSVNLKNLLPERKITWMQLDKKGRRIEVGPFAGNAGNSVDDITNEEMLSDHDVTSNQVKNEDERESDVGVAADKQAKDARVEPMKSANLKNLLPERKIIWMKLDKKGRRIEVDPYSSNEDENLDDDSSAIISHLSNEEMTLDQDKSSKVEGSLEDADEFRVKLITDELANKKERGDSDPTENIQPIKSVNLKNLLPARKITWMKLDKKGRRIELDPYSVKDGENVESDSSIVSSDFSNEAMVSDHDITRELVESVQINDAFSVNMILDELAKKDGAGDAEPTENIQPMKSVNLKNLLPARKVTWMKLDKKGRRIEVDLYSGNEDRSKALDSTVVLKDITHEEMSTDLDVTKGLVQSVEGTDEFSVKMILDEVADDEGINFTKLSERIQPMKSANLKNLLPTRKVKWMKLDKMGRRIEVDPNSEQNDEESDIDDITTITSDSTNNDVVSDRDSDLLDSIENEEYRFEQLVNEEVLAEVDNVKDFPPIKSVNLKSLLPTRKMTWMKLDKKGRRVEALDFDASSNSEGEVDYEDEPNYEDTIDELVGEEELNDAKSLEDDQQ